MDGPELLRRQLLLRGELTLNEVKTVLEGVPHELKRREECERIIIVSGGRARLAVEKRLVDAVGGGRYDIESAPRELKLYWRQLKVQSRKLPLKELEGGGLAKATKLNATGKQSLLRAVGGGVEAIDAAFDYPGAQQHVLELIAEGKVAVEGSRLVVVD